MAWDAGRTADYDRGYRPGVDTKGVIMIPSFFLDIIEASPGWITRRELAKVAGRAGYALNNRDRIALKSLIERGYIEARLSREHCGGVGAWEYRRVER